MIRRCSVRIWAMIVSAIARSAPIDTPQPGSDRCGHQVRIGERREVDEDHTIAEVFGHLPRDGEGEPRLADAAGTGEGQEGDGFVEEKGA
jgi:hypothetical protein